MGTRQTKEQRYRWWLCAGLLAVGWLGFVLPGQAAEPGKTGAASPPELLVLANQYVKIVVNAGDLNAGRFALETTGGDPDLLTDDNKPLIYGRPRPWTSYTTIRVDGQDYIFGGQTEHRAGRKGKYGVVIQPPVKEDEAIRATWQLGPIEATQTLRIIQSSTTGWPDTMEIRYTLINKDKQPHQVGLRMVLDTMLGENDGAPFRIGERAITSDTVFTGGLPDFWQAFDSLQDPKVTAQGTLKGPGVTTPDKVYISNWGSLADGTWDFDFKPGRELIRAGEYEPDSAIALQWNPRTLSPGEEWVVVTAYGIGGITIAPGELSLGLTSPATVWPDAAGKIRIPVVAYLENAATTRAHNVRFSLLLPEGVTVSPGQKMTRSVGEVPSRGTVQVAWDLWADPKLAGQTITYGVTVEAANARPNTVKRSVKILAPPKLKLTLSGTKELKNVDERYFPDGFPVKVHLENQGGAPAYLVTVSCQPGTGLELVPLDKSQRYLGTIKPGEAVDITWLLQPKPGSSGDLVYTVSAVAGSMGGTQVRGSVKVPFLEPKIWLKAPDRILRPGEVFTVDVLLTNVAAVAGAKFAIRYDPRVLQLIQVTRGTLFADDANKERWQVSPPAGAGETGLIQGACLEQWVRYESLAGLAFRVLMPGKTKLELVKVEVLSHNPAQKLKVEGVEITIPAP